jgi:plastocyanin
MRKLVFTLALASIAALALAACGSSSSSSSSSSTPATSSSGGGGGGGGSAGGGGGGGGTAAVGNSTVPISADPSGALKYQQTSVTTIAGKVTVDFTNDSPVGHNVTISDSSGKTLGATQTITGGKSSATVDLKPGTYTFFCSVDSHEQAGMKGTLTVK